MFRYFSKFIEDTKIYAYNYFNSTGSDDSVRIYPPFPEEEKEPDANFIADVEPVKDWGKTTTTEQIDDKKLRIDTLLLVRQYKNTYYKYAKKDKFNPELYNSFIDDKHFDGGQTGYDEDENIRIFDKYLLEYIKNRSDVLTFLQCKNKEAILKDKLEQLNDIYLQKSKSSIDVLFVIDMNEKDAFNYCYHIIHKTGNVSLIKSIMLSFVIKYNREYIRIKLSAFSKTKNNHPYLILEKFIA
jgi:hypothetical protein